MINLTDFKDFSTVQKQVHKLIKEKPKLNLGCNTDIREGYINIDILQLDGVDVIADIGILSHTIPETSIENILAYDVLEHFSFDIVPVLLKEWVSWLKPDGTILVRVPDLERIAQALIDKKLPLAMAQKLIYGGQDYEYNFHKAGFSGGYLEGLLIGAGCSEIIQIVREPFDHNVVVIGKR